MPSKIDRRIPAALLILRFFLAIFLLQWSIEKLILPDAAARIASSFYSVTLPAAGSYALGIAELILSLLVHTVTVIVSWRRHPKKVDCARKATGIGPPMAKVSLRDRACRLAPAVEGPGVPFPHQEQRGKATPGRPGRDPQMVTDLGQSPGVE